MTHQRRIIIRLLVTIWLGNMGAVLLTLGTIHNDNFERFVGLSQILVMASFTAIHVTQAARQS